MGRATDSVKKIVRNTGVASVLGIDPSTVGTATAASEGAKAIEKHLTPDIPEIPAAPTPTPMPIPGQDTLEAIMARRRSIQAQLARRGRLSTILAQPQYEPLGG